MELETRNSDQIAETLIRCQGVKIILLFQTFRKGRELFDSLEKYLTFIKAVANVSRRADIHVLDLVNESSLYALPAVEQALCGVRAHQVIVNEALKDDEQVLNTVARPLITSRQTNIFRSEVFLYAP